MSTPRIAPGTRRQLGWAVWAFTRLAALRTRTGPPALFTVLGRHRRLFRRWLWFAAALMPGGRLPRRDTELVILRVAALRGNDYETRHHTALGRAAGLTAEEMNRLREPHATTRTAPPTHTDTTHPPEPHTTSRATTPTDTDTAHLPEPHATSRTGRATTPTDTETTHPREPDSTGWTGRDAALLAATDALVRERDLDDACWQALRAELSDVECIELCLLVTHYDLLATVITALRIPPDRPRPRAGR